MDIHQNLLFYQLNSEKPLSINDTQLLITKQPDCCKISSNIFLQNLINWLRLQDVQTAGLQWHPGNGPAVEFNRQNGSPVT